MIDYKWNELRKGIDKVMEEYDIEGALCDDYKEDAFHYFVNDLMDSIRKHFEGD